MRSQYELYLSVVKPLTADVESLYQEYPIEILNEIRAYTDHLMRCQAPHATEQNIDSNLDKAYGHLNRVTLDLYKFLNVHYYRMEKQFEKRIRNINIAAINNGTFYIEFKELHANAINSVRHAKEQESKNISSEEKYRNYEISLYAYRELMKYIDENETAIIWAKVKFWGRSAFKVFTWIAALLLGCIIQHNLDKILQVFSQK